MRVVLDTAAFVAAVRSRTGAAREVLRLTFERKFVLLMDYKLGLEYREVALRPEHVAAAESSQNEVMALIEALETFAEPVTVGKLARPLSTDPNDDMMLELAVHGKADALVTTNTKHFRAAASRFKILVITPAELLRLLRKEVENGD